MVSQRMYSFQYSPRPVIAPRYESRRRRPSPINLPKANENDLKDMPQEVRDELTFILVERIEEVLPAAFNHDIASPVERDEPLATSTTS